MYNTMLIRYGEIGLKGKNRYQFEKLLINNIKKSLEGLEVGSVDKSQGRIYVHLKENNTSGDREEVLTRLSKVFGIVSISPAVKVDWELENIKDTSVKLLSNAYQQESTFKVDCRRADKRFHINSMELNKQLGAHLLNTLPGLTVDVHTPDLTLAVEIRENGTYIYCDRIEGPGGLPVGSTGKGVLLLSGGIDSPVAGWYAMKRGIEVIAIHFHSYPFTSERAREKVEDLAKVLSYHGGTLKLYLNHFTDIQKEIQQNTDDSMSITTMRRFMFRIAEEIAKKEGALCLLTGENIGQVSSQTMESINVINDVVDIPVIRPLSCFDKRDISKKAEEIDTYSISIRPHEDCCTLFLPEHPKTKPRISQAEKEENKLDVNSLIEDSLKQTEIKYMAPDRGLTLDL